MKKIKITINGNVSFTEADWLKGWEMLEVLNASIDGDVRLSDDSEINGTVSVPVVSQSVLSRLNTHFGSSFVSRNSRYIQFEDKEVLQILYNATGSLPLVSNPPDWNTVRTLFSNNQKIKTFDEWPSLKNITQSNSQIYVFEKCGYLEHVSIPSGLTLLYLLFYQCTSLKSAIVPDGVTTLRSTFAHCNSLESVTLPSSLKRMETIYYEGNNAGVFLACTNLRSIELPDSMDFIGSDSFAYCNNLERVKLPSTISSFNSGSLFRQCSKLDFESLPDWLTTISPYCFDFCTSLSLKKLPSTVVSIGDYAFRECKNLQLDELPDGLQKILSSGFYRCSSITISKIPDSVTTLGTNCFNGCSSIERLEISSGLKELPSNGFANCANLREVIFNGEIETMGANAFSTCPKLEMEVYPSKLTTVPQGTFYDCYIVNISEFNENVIHLEVHCFTRAYRMYACKFLSRQMLAYDRGDCFNSFVLIFVRDELLEQYRADSYCSTVFYKFKGLSQVDYYTNSFGLKLIDKSGPAYTQNVLYPQDQGASAIVATLLAATSKLDLPYPRANKLLSPIPIPLGTTALRTSSNTKLIKQDLYRIATDSASTETITMPHKSIYQIPANFTTSQVWVIYGMYYVNTISSAPNLSDIDFHLYAEVGSTTYEFDQSDNNWKPV